MLTEAEARELTMRKLAYLELSTEDRYLRLLCAAAQVLIRQDERTIRALAEELREARRQCDAARATDIPVCPYCGADWLHTELLYQTKHIVTCEACMQEFVVELGEVFQTRCRTDDDVTLEKIKPL